MNKKLKKYLILAIVIIAASYGMYAQQRGLSLFEVEEETAAQETAQPQATEAPQIAEDVAADEQETAAEEESFDIAELYGTVIEVTDAYVLLESAEFGKVQANLTDDTTLEGVEKVEIGQVVKVLYDGKMTRSIPAQVTAMLVGVYAVEGEVTEAADGRITVKRADTGEEVIISLPEGAQEIAVGDVVTAYTNGISTMSLPPQMNAVAIVK